MASSIVPATDRPELIWELIVVSAWEAWRRIQVHGWSNPAHICTTSAPSSMRHLTLLRIADCSSKSPISARPAAAYSARKPPYVAPRCARRPGNVVCIDHGIFLRHSWALSVVHQGLRSRTRIVFQPRSRPAESYQPHRTWKELRKIARGGAVQNCNINGFRR